MQRQWKYQCVKCKKVYVSPLELLYCSHKCTPKAKSQEMKPIKDDEEDNE